MPDRVAQMHSRLGRNLATFPAHMDIPRALGHYRSAEAILSGAAREQRPGVRRVRAGQHGAVGGPGREGVAAAEQALAIADRLGQRPPPPPQRRAPGHHLASAGRLAEGFSRVGGNWREADAARDGMRRLHRDLDGAALWLFDLRDPGRVAGLVPPGARHAPAAARRPYPRARPSRQAGPGRGPGRGSGRRPPSPRRGRRQPLRRSLHRLLRGPFRRSRCRCGKPCWIEDRRAGNRRDEWTELSGLGLLRPLGGTDGRGRRDPAARGAADRRRRR